MLLERGAQRGAAGGQQRAKAVLLRPMGIRPVGWDALMEEAGVPPHVIDLGVLHQKRKGISRTYMHHNYTAEKKDAVESWRRC